eukprot:5742723-Prymnesium_polylepis.1
MERPWTLQEQCGARALAEGRRAVRAGMRSPATAERDHEQLPRTAPRQSRYWRYAGSIGTSRVQVLDHAPKKRVDAPAHATAIISAIIAVVYSAISVPAPPIHVHVIGVARCG